MSVDWLQALGDWLAHHPGWLEAALFGIAFLESLAIAGIIIPGVAMIFLVATLAGQIGMPVLEALMWACAGAITGDAISFWLGRLFQGRLDTIWPFSRYPAIVAKGERFFNEHGGKSVVIGRFVGPIRPVIPMVAGALMMPWRRFLVFNVSSAIGWAPVYVLPGFLVGNALASEVQLPPHFYPVLAVSLGVLAVVYLVLFRVQLGLGNDSRIYQWMARWMGRYNTTHRFWRLYTSRRPASGGEFPLPSVILGLGAGFLFVLWALLATETHWLEPFDNQVLQYFIRLRHPMLDTPMLAITLLTDPAVILAAALAAVLTLVFRGYYAAALHIVIATTLSLLTVWLFKSGFDILRPDAVSQPPSSGAFPSGHTLGATVLLGLLASFAARETQRPKRWRVYLLYSLPIVLVGVSRVFLGVHWVSDVIGGLLLGLAICGSVRASFSRYDQVPVSLDAVSLLAIIGWGVFAVGYVVVRWETAILYYTPVPI